MILKRNKTFGDSRQLRKLISNSITKDDFEKMRDAKKEVVVCVANITRKRLEYKSLHEFRPFRHRSCNRSSPSPFSCVPPDLVFGQGELIDIDGELGVRIVSLAQE